MNFAGNICLLLAVAAENAACLWFVREMVYKKEQALAGGEVVCLFILGTGAALMEFLNRAYFVVFSESMLLIKTAFLLAPVLATRRKKGGTALAAAAAFLTLNMLADFLMEFLLAFCIDGYRYSYVYVPRDAFVRKTGMLFVRSAGLLLCFLLQKEEAQQHNEKLLWVFSLAGYVSMRYFYIILNMNSLAEKVIGIFCLAAVIAVFVLGLFSSSFYQKNQEDLELLEQKNRMLEMRSEKIYTLYKENQYLSHDLKNHVNLLNQLMRHGKYGKAAVYLEKLQGPVAEMEEIAVSGNSIIDLILSDKKSTAKDKDIKMILDIDRIGILPFLEQDLCVMLSNLLDNAIEACEHVEDMEKWIRVAMKRDGNILLLCIENSFQGEIVLKNGKIMTNKKEIKRHGIGIESVKYVIDKYQGDIKQEIKGCIFCCSVVLFL